MVAHPAGLATRGVGQPFDYILGWRQYDNLAGVNGATRNIYKAPGDKIVLFQSIYLTYVSDATAGSRSVVLQMLDPDGNIAREALCSTVQSVSDTQFYTFGWEASGGGVNIGKHSLFPLWQDFIREGWQVNVAPLAADAGDTIGPVRLIYDVYIQGHGGYETGWQEKRGSGLLMPEEGL